MNNQNFSPHPNDTASPISTQLYPYHQQAFRHYTPPVHSAARPQPYHHQSYPSYDQRAPTIPIPPPPIPPKPPVVFPQIEPTTVYNVYAAPSPPHIPQLSPLAPVSPPSQLVEEVPSPIDDSNELAMALALSQTESVERKKVEEQLLDQEEQDLARALAESMLSTGGNLQENTNPFFFPANAVASSSRTTTHDTRTEASPTPPSLGLPAQEVPQKGDTVYPADLTNPFADFGQYNKWRVPDRPQEQAASIESRTESSSPRFSFSGLTFPTSESSNEKTKKSQPASRPSSFSSASSLPYTLPDPPIHPSALDGKDPLPEYTQAEATQPTPQDAPAASTSTLPTNSDAVEFTEHMDTVLVFDDEAYARQLEAEEQELARQYSEEKTRPPDSQGDQPSEESLPQYTSNRPQQSSRIEKVPIRLVIPSQAMPTANGTSRPTPTQPQHPALGGGQFRQQEYAPRPISSSPEAGPSAPFYPGNRRQSDSDTRSESSHRSPGPSSTGSQTAHPERLNLNHHTEQQPPQATPERRPSYSAVPPSQIDNRPGTIQHVPSPVALNANHFLDRELLLGVSIGFKPPTVSMHLAPLADPMPNLISLPYARCPPLHLQAPDWRHLLRLMARLSGTRIEPTVEAMAISRTELKLRTVVQFIKPHPSSADWRTILWFTIDHPVPPGAPGAARYSSGNTNLLPWSYTLSPVPMLLRDAADTHTSKTFTIPGTDTVPLPNLPITFPNLALYLQAAWDASRRHPGDGANGLGKLGKVVQMCYPSVEQTFSEFDIPGRSSVSGLFKRVIGRGNKDKKKGKHSNNEETYQLVTPFVPDEWG